MKSVGEILKRHLPRTPAFRRVEAAMVVEEGNTMLSDHFGAAFQKYARVLYFKSGILTITCLSSIIAQEIRLRERTLITALNNKLGGQYVHKLRTIA